ncbi:MAG: PEP-utilizing enzyme [Candidatus Parvarchaeum sp.]
MQKIDNKGIAKLKGTVAYPGNTRGKALLVKDKHFKQAKREYILIAEATYPEYIPIMLKAKGIITEVGGILSHAAIVAREFKIPCIVGVEGATDKIKDNDQITMQKDGVIYVEYKRK